MSEIATAYVQIVPTAKGIQSAIENAVGEAGQSSGKSLGGALAGGIKAAGAAIAGATVAATGAMVGFGASAVKTGAEFDSAMSQVAATMGKSVSEITELRDFAQEMGSTTAFSASQAAEALNYMALAGYDAETSMSMLPTVLDLAAAGGMELARASDMVTDAQSALGLSLSETSAMVDQMAKASSMTNTSVEQLGDALLKIGATARNVAGGTNELATVLGVLADNGIKGTEGGTHLRNILLSLQSAAEDGIADFGDFSVAVYDADGNMRSMVDIISEMQAGMDGMSQASKDALISGVFNKTDLAAVNALLGTEVSRFDEISSALEDAGGLSSILGDKLGGMVEEMQYNFERLGGDVKAFSDEMLDYLVFEYDIADTEKAQAAIDTFLEQVQNGVTSTEELERAIGAVGSAASAMGKTQLDNLAGDITMFQSALEGAKIAVSDQLTPTLRDLVQFGTEGLSRLTEAFKEGGLSGAMEELGNILSDGINMAVENLPGIIDAGMKLLEALVGGIVDNLNVILDAGMQIIEMIGNAIIENLPQLIMVGFEILAKLANSIAESLPTLIPAIVDVLLEIVNIIIDNIDVIIEVGGKLLMGLLEGLMNALPKFIMELPKIIVALTKALVDAIPKMGMLGLQLIGGLIEGLGNALPALGVAVYNLVTSIIDWFKEKLGIHSPSTVFAGFGDDLIQGLISGIKSMLASLGKTVLSVVDKITDTFTGLFDKAKNWGKDLIEGFIGGIKDKIGKVKDAVSGIAETVADYIHFSEPDVGPLAHFHEFAPDMMELFAEGIYDNIRMVGDAMDTLSDDIRSQFTNPSVVDTAVQGSRSVETRQLRQDADQGTVPAWGGNLTIPVYIGRRRIEEFVIDAINSNNYRSGGR